MSEFHATVVKLGPMVSHPNADSLNITKVFDYQVITKKDGFKEGDLVVYVPIDSVVPDTEYWHFLCPLDENKQPRYPVGSVPEKYRVIEAKKLRGIFSQGILAPLPERKRFEVTDDNLDAPDGTWTNTHYRSGIYWYPIVHREGDDVTEEMGLKKWEPTPSFVLGGDTENDPIGWDFAKYTDIEGLRRYPNILEEGETVVITEKLHGTNARYAHDGERLWVGSHHQNKKYSEKSVYWQVAEKLDFNNKLKQYPFHIFFGEVYGNVQDLKYGMNNGQNTFACFDIYDVVMQKYLDYGKARVIAHDVGIPWVPVLYSGPWKNDLNELAEGATTLLNDPKHVREGFVVRPGEERWHQEIGRVILKRHGEGYLLRKKNK